MAGGKEDLERIENDTYRYLDVGILVKSKLDAEGCFHRSIDQIGIFERYGKNWNETVNQVVMLVEDGEIINRLLPKSLVRKFQDQGIHPGTEWRLS